MNSNRLPRSLVLGLVLLLLSAPGALAAVTLQVVDSEVDDPADSDPYTALAPFDIDADGLPDIVSAGEAKGLADWRHSRPTPAGLPNLDGSVNRPGISGGAPQPRDGLESAVIAGRPWLVVFDPSLPVIDLFGFREGTLDKNDQTVLAENIQSVAIGDVNTDDLPDVVVLFANGDVSVIPGEAGGFPGNVDFDNANQVPVGDVAGTPVAVRLADVAGSALADVVVLTSGADTKLHVATALDSSPVDFTALAASNIPANPRDVELADMDGDGLRDVVLGTNAGVSVARNETGTGGQVVGATSSRPAGVMADVAIGDVDGDGSPEIAGATSGTLSIELFDVVGTSPSAGERFLTTNGFNELIAVDLEGDGADEVVVAGAGIDVLTNTSPGSMAATPSPADLGTVEVGRVGPPVAVTLTNQREGTERVRSVHVEGDAAFEVLVTDGCTEVLAPGEQCSLHARLSPTAIGARSAQVRVGLLHAEDLVVPVSGQGAAPVPGPPGADGAPGPPGAPGTSGANQRAAVLTTIRCRRPRSNRVRCRLRLADETDLAGELRLVAGRRIAGEVELPAGADRATVAGRVPPARRRVAIELELDGLAAQRVRVGVPRG